MIALGKEVIEELIMNLKDAGCDEELITKCIKKYNNGAVISLKNLIDTSGESSLCFRPLDPQITSSLAFIWKKYRVLSKPAQYFLKVLEEETKKAHKCSQINKNMIK